MGGSPRVTLIIPVRDGALHIAEALRSALGQLGPDDEALVIDDGSTDGTRRGVAAVEDRRVRLLSGDGRGVSAARNLGVAAARGDLVAFLDHDDLWPAGRQTALLAALEGAPDRGAAFGRVRVRIDPGACDVEEARGLDGRHICELIGSGLYRARAVRKIGGFDETLHLREDADFHSRLIESGEAPLLLDVDALIYRRHAGNATNDRAAMRRSLIDLARRKLVRAKKSRSSAGA